MSNSRKEKSLLIFQAFVEFKTDGEVDVTQLFSKRCFDYWLQSRSHVPKNPPEAFRKALTSHCSGVDGRIPFEPKIEKALLIELRKKQVWECFKNTPCKVGQRGLQVKGYWEKQNSEGDVIDTRPLKKRRGTTRKAKVKRVRTVKQDFQLTKQDTKAYEYLASGSELLFVPLEGYESFYPKVYKVVDPFEELLTELK